MPSYFGRSSSSYFGATPVKLAWSPPAVGATSTPKKDTGFSFGGFLGNLLGDIKDTAVGFFPGVWEFAKHPVRGFEQMGEYYKATYGPLFQGDFSSFARNIYEHPLGPILDATAAATLPFSLGASAAARGGSLLGRAGLISGDTAARLGGLTARNVRVFRSPALQFGENAISDPVAFGKQIRAGNILPDAIPEGVAVLSGARGPTQRVVQRSLDRITGRLDQLLPDRMNIETFRYGRSEARKVSIDLAQSTAQLSRWQRSYARLTKPEEKAAYTFLSRGIDLEQYRNILLKDKNGEIARAVEPSMRKLIESKKTFPKIQALVANPSKHMLEAVEEGRRLGQLDMAIQLRHEADPIKRAVLQTEMENAPWRNAQLATGARYVSESEISKRVREIDSEVAHVGTRIAQSERAATKIEKSIESPPEKPITPTAAEIKQVKQETATISSQKEATTKRRELVQAEDNLLKDLQTALRTETESLERIAGGVVDVNDYSRLGVRLPKEKPLGGDVQRRLVSRQYNKVSNIIKQVERAAYTQIGSIKALGSDVALAERQALNTATTAVRATGQATGVASRVAQNLRAERRGLLAKEKEKLENLKVVRGLAQSSRERIAEMVPGFHGGKSISELKQEFREAGKIDPIYLPDHFQPLKVNLGRMGGGAGPQTWKHYVNRGLAAQFGRIAVGQDTLGPKFMSTVKKEMATNIHKTLVASAKKIPEGTALPKGWVFIRRGTKEKITYAERHRGDFDEEMSHLLKEDDFADITTIDEGLAEETGAGRLIVPKSLVKQMAGEFHRSSKFMNYVLEKPTQFFRLMVLGARPAFFVNNLVGNHALYAISFGGYFGLRGYVEAIRREHGDGFVRSMLEHKGVPWHARPMYQALMEEFFPDQIHGTFGATQAPKFSWMRHPKMEKFRRISLGVLPATQAVAEGALRRAGVITELRKSPAVQKFVKDMPEQSRNFELGARAALDADPKLARSISDTVNRALGDYFGMSSFERHYVRSVFPFYAWYRAISMVTLRLPADHPGRALIGAQLGMLGIEEVRERMGFLPSFLLGSIDMDPEIYDVLPMVDADGNRRPILNTAPLNPFATIQQLVEGAESLVAGEPGSIARDVGSMMGPVPQGLLQAISGRDVLTGQEIEGKLPGILGAVEQGFGSIPQAVIPKAYISGPENPERKLFDQDPDRLLLNWAGLPIRQVNPNTARFMKNLEEGLLKQINLIVPNK